MMTKKDILEILKELILNHDYNRMNLEYADIHLSDTLMDDLGFDSLDVTELSISLENKLKIQIHSVEVEKVMQQLDIEGLMNFLYDRYREAREQEV